MADKFIIKTNLKRFNETLKDCSRKYYIYFKSTDLMELSIGKCEQPVLNLGDRKYLYLFKIELTDSYQDQNNNYLGSIKVLFLTYDGFENEFIKKYKKVKIIDGDYSVTWDVKKNNDWFSDDQLIILNKNLSDYKHNPNNNELIIEFL